MRFFTFKAAIGLSLVLSAAKLFGLTTMSWWLVWSPFLVVLAALLFVAMLIGLFVILSAALTRVPNARLSVITKWEKE